MGRLGQREDMIVLEADFAADLEKEGWTIQWLPVMSASVYDKFAGTETVKKKAPKRPPLKIMVIAKNPKLSRETSVSGKVQRVLLSEMSHGLAYRRDEVQAILEKNGYGQVAHHLGDQRKRGFLVKPPPVPDEDSPISSDERKDQGNLNIDLH